MKLLLTLLLTFTLANASVYCDHNPYADGCGVMDDFDGGGKYL